ncbi:hypothetical protein AAMO2058_001692700, partial [Amorphochlora amoebiformis]
DEKEEKDEEKDTVFQHVGGDLKSRDHICIRNLRKEFQTEGKKFNLCGSKDVVKALRGLDLKIFPGEILALLGHNGAGKSTTIGVLTGLFPPSSGSVHLGTDDMIKDMDRFRRKMGVCPQHDILFDDLTVKEHLLFYAALKGVQPRMMQSEVSMKISELDLTEKRNSAAKTLSGGQKRRLSIAIALIGDSTIIFLDEPTAGVDPLSRHKVWLMLQRYKEGRTIILTTHHMDEADLLGDRIAILANGRLRCYGTSMFLKARLGSGYQLDMIKSSAEVPSHEIINLIQRLIPGAQPATDLGQQVAVTLPYERVDCFSRLFKVLEESGKQDYGIANFGISLTTLEQVFLKIAEQPDEEGEDIGDSTRSPGKDTQEDTQIDVDRDDIDANEATRRFLGEGADRSESRGGCTDGPCCGLIIKRWLVATRESRSVLLQFVFPLLYVILLLVALKTIDLALYSRHVEPQSLDLSFSPPRGPYNETEMRIFGHLTPSLCNMYSSLKIVNEHTPFAPKPTLYRATQSTEDASKSMIRWLAHPKHPASYAAILSRGFDLNHFSARLLRNTSTPHVFPMLHSVAINSYLAFRASKSTRQTDHEHTEHTIESGSAEISHGHRPWWHFVGNFRDFLDKGKMNKSAVMQGGGDRCPVIEEKGEPWTFQVESHPLPYETGTGGRVAAMQRALLMAITLGLCYSSIPLTSLVNIVKEKEKQIRLHLRISSVPAFSYWSAHMFTDFILYLIPVGVTYALFSAFNEPTLLGGGDDGYRPAVLCASLAIFLGYGIHGTITTYFLSFWFEKTVTAQTVVSIVFVWGGLGLIFATIAMNSVVDVSNPSGLSSAGEDTEAFIILGLCILPSYAFMWGIYQLVMYIEKLELLTETAEINRNSDAASVASSDPAWGLLEWERLGCVIFGVFAWSVINMLLIAFLESNISCSPSRTSPPPNPNPNPNQVLDRKSERSDDVQAEWTHVSALISNANSRNLQNSQNNSGIFQNSQNSSLPPLVVHGLSKSYVGGFSFSLGGGGERNERKLAVDNLSFAVGEGHCFGLLGPNGAGKTTTIKMLIGEETPTFGDGWIAGSNIRTEISKAYKKLGVCLQADALVEQMTGREHLAMYCRIRGLPYEDRTRIIDSAIRAVGITEHADKLTSEYSGRRSVLLTTHSMEEADALCTRMGILVNGSLQCIGSSQHLKSRFGTGYHMEIQTAESEGAIERVKEFILHQICSDAIILKAFGGKLRFELPKIGVSLSQVFAAIELKKKELRIRDYSLSQTTLEQVFIGFARLQEEENRGSIDSHNTRRSMRSRHASSIARHQ